MVKTWFPKIFFCIFAALLLASQPGQCSAAAQVHYQADSGYPPLSYVKDGEMYGFSNVLIDKIFENSGYSLHITFDSWERVYERTKNGETDMCGLTAITDERRKEILFSKPVLKTYIGLYTRKDFAGISAGEFKNLRIGAVNCKYTIPRFEKYAPGGNITEYRDYGLVLRDLQQGVIDVIAADQEMMNFILIEYGFRGTVTLQIPNFIPVEFAYGVNREKEYLVRYINGKLDALIKNGEFENIFTRFFTHHSEYYSSRNTKYAFFRILLIIGSILGASVILQISSRLYIRYLKRKVFLEHEFSKSVVDIANMLIVRISSDGYMLEYNSYAEKKSMYSREEVMGLKWLELLVAPQNRNDVLSMIRGVKSGRMLLENLEYPIECKDGRHLYVYWNVRGVRDDKGGLMYIELMGLDITERKKSEKDLYNSHKQLSRLYEELKETDRELRQKYEELEATKEMLAVAEERHRLAADGSKDVLWDWNLRTNDMFFSERWKELTGINVNDPECNSEILNSLMHPDDSERVKKALSRHFSGEDPFYNCEYRIVTKEGIKWMHARGKMLKDENGVPVRIAGSLTDITERREYENKVKRLAYCDTLTGLPNRIAMTERLTDELERAKRGESRGALLFIDIDDFKSINDTSGHSFGDNVLFEIGRRIKDVIGTNGFVARLGGDEFIVLESFDDTGAVDEKAFGLAHKILKHMKEPVTIKDKVMHVMPSIGIALYPQHGSSIDGLLKCADMAMYRAKITGKRSCRMYDSIMNDEVLDKMVIEMNLRSALKNNEFVLHFQPQYDLREKRITGFEALLRWHSPQHGVVRPLKFIEIAEKSGLIIEIGGWVLREVCSLAGRYCGCMPEPMSISVNISVMQLVQDGFADMVKRVLDETGLPCGCLGLEITETVLMESVDENVERLMTLKNMGIKIILDDFGKGYSSLTYLKQLPISVLKIDKAFVDGVNKEKVNKDITDLIIKLAHRMELKVVAEGVETDDQLEYLREAGCDMIQGYLVSKPVLWEEAVSLLEKQGS